MSAPEGGFCAAEDADSEGEEGRFYVWTEQEIRDALPRSEADLVIRAFGVSAAGNFRDEATGRNTGKNILHLKADGGIPILEEPDAKARLEKARTALFSIREGRIHPLRDDKVLTDWNGLMIAALARGARAFEEPRYAEAARGATAFLEQRLSGEGGRLLHRFRDGHAGIGGHLDDYAFMIWWLIELYEATLEEAHLRRALELAGAMRARFEDTEEGGFFFAARETEDLIVRRKEIQDTAVPSGNSVAALRLFRLARLTGRDDLEKVADGVLRALGGAVERFPSAFTFLLCALDFTVGPTQEVVIVGDRNGEGTRAMLRVLGCRFLPDTVTLFRPAGPGDREIDDIAPFVRSHETVDDKATAYVCRNRSCRAPVTGLEEFLGTIERPVRGV
ncbi:MAG: hypothetical protein R6V25_00510 [Desulfatiglandales bacterium]